MPSDAPQPASVVIAAGGTGGHIYPGLALADAVRNALPAARISFVGTARGLESTLVTEAGHPLHLVGMVPFSGRERLLAPLALTRASWQCRRILRREAAAVAVGMGGYAALPLVVAARLSGVPSLIHESGAVAGRANRLAARFTPNVALAWEHARASLPADEVRVVGMPVSDEMASYDGAALRKEAREAFGLDPDVAMVLVVGGSQGSARLNRLALDLAARWRSRRDVRIVLKAGRPNVAEVRERIAAAELEGVVEAVAYLDRMDHAYAAADAGVFRAGAGTVAELAIVGLPSVLVPYPYAPDDHQAVNAGVLVDAGAAVLVRDGDADGDRVGPVLESWVDDRDALGRMASAARTVARPHAAHELAAWALELAGAGGSAAAGR